MSGNGAPTTRKTPSFISSLGVLGSGTCVGVWIEGRLCSADDAVDAAAREREAEASESA